MPSKLRPGGRQGGIKEGRKERWRGEKQGAREERGEAAEKVRDGQEREQPQNGKGVIEWTGRTNLLLLKAAVILQT